MSFERTTEQRRDALTKANSTRHARAELKEELKMGRRRVGDVLEQPPGYLLKMKVYDLLLAVPSVGKVKAAKVLVRCEISATKTVGGLSERQRLEIVRYVQRAHVGMVDADRQPSRAVA